MMSKLRSLMLGLLVVAACGCQPGTPAVAPSQKVQESAETDMHSETVDPAVIRAEMAKLGEADRELALKQGYCVVSREPLGSMGVPLKVTLDDGRSVFICCKGCEELVRSKPEDMLARVPDLEARTQREHPAGDASAATPSESNPATATDAAPAEAKSPTPDSAPATAPAAGDAPQK